MRQSPRLRLAGEHRADLHRLDARRPRSRRAVSSSISSPASTSSVWRPSRPLHADRSTSSRGHAADDALAQRLDDVLAFLERADLEAEDRAAILLGDRHVLRHVHQPARQVAGVGRLERRVGQTLAGAVRRDEVLEHRQPFTEVRLDRALDDLADAARQLLLRLRHQAAHARQLADLVAATARAGVEHHEHGVEPAAWTRASPCTIASATSLLACVQVSITLL